MTYLAKYRLDSTEISKQSIKYNRSYSTKFKHWPIIDFRKSTGGR